MIGLLIYPTNLLASLPAKFAKNMGKILLGNMINLEEGISHTLRLLMTMMLMNGKVICKAEAGYWGLCSAREWLTARLFIWSNQPLLLSISASTLFTLPPTASTALPKKRWGFKFKIQIQIQLWFAKKKQPFNDSNTKYKYNICMTKIRDQYLPSLINTL